MNGSATAPMTRAEMLAAGLDRSGRYVEVGPSHNPLLRKSDGWNVAVVDHLDRAGLVEKYAAHPNVDTTAIEDVDHVWSGEPLGDLFPKRSLGTFDAVVASHVVEHTTDIVGFLREASRLIAPDGRIVLAVPDKRMCFDFFRPVSTTAEAILAFREGRTRHDARTLFDYAAYAATCAGAISWSHRRERPVALVGSLHDAHAVMEQAEADAYVDAHKWVWTPSSFELMLLELRALDLVDVVASEVRPMPGTEFFAWLKRGAFDGDPEALQLRRSELASAVVAELGVQAGQIAPDGPSPIERQLREELAGRDVLVAHLQDVIARMHGELVHERRFLPVRVRRAVSRWLERARARG